MTNCVETVSVRDIQCMCKYCPPIGIQHLRYSIYY